MDYTFAIVTGIIETFLIAIYLKKIKLFEVNVIESEDTERKEASEDNESTIDGSHVRSKKGHFLISSLIIAVSMVGAAVLLIKDVSSYTNFLKLITLLGIIAAAAVVDLKQKIIPNMLIVLGLAIRSVIYVVEYFLYHEIFFEQLKTDLFGFFIGFGVFFIASVVTRGAVGFGDVKLFGVIGLLSGGICTYSTMIFSLLVSAVSSIILLIVRKKSRKDSIPFGPCIFVGYMISIILSSY